MAAKAYKTHGQTIEPPEFDDLMRRRVRPLMDTFGLTTRTFEHLMKEAYRIGFLDAVDAMNEKRD